MGSIKHVLLALRKTRLIIVEACRDGEMNHMVLAYVGSKPTLARRLKLSQNQIHSSCFESIVPFLFTKRFHHVSSLFPLSNSCVSKLVVLQLHLPSLAVQCCAMTRTRSQMSRILRGFEELIVACRDHMHAAVLRTHWHQWNPQPKSIKVMCTECQRERDFAKYIRSLHSLSLSLANLTFIAGLMCLKKHKDSNIVIHHNTFCFVRVSNISMPIISGSNMGKGFSSNSRGWRGCRNEHRSRTVCLNPLDKHSSGK